MSQSRQPPFDIGIDISVILIAVFYFSGLCFITDPDWNLLISQKPWVHRVLMSVIGLLLFGLIYLGFQRKTALAQFLLFITKLPDKILLSLLYGSSVLIMGVSSSVRHEIFHSGFDMAIFTQAVWNTAHGDWFYSSIKGGVNLMSDHFSPILGIVAIIYRVIPSPHVLLWLQSAAALACLFPLHALMSHCSLSRAQIYAVLMSFTYYLPLRNAIRFDFHPELLVMPLIISAHVLLMQGKFRWGITTLLMFIVVLSKESAALVVAWVGLYSCIFLNKRVWGLLTTIIACLYFIIVTQWVIPHIFHTDFFYLSSNYLAWKDHGGITALFKHLFSLSTAAYLTKIFMPVAFMSCFHPSILLAVPALAQNLCARNEQARSIFFQYTAYLTPFVFVSAVYGLRKVRPQLGAAILILLSLTTTGVSEFFIISKALNKYEPKAQISTVLNAIPADESVRTNEFLAPHLAHRRELHIYENNHPKEGASHQARMANVVVLKRSLLGEQWNPATNVLKMEGYRQVTEHEDIYVFKRHE